MHRLKISPLIQPIKAEVSIPGSKSYTNRALLMAALAPHPVKIINPLMSDDTEAMIACLSTLGIEITRHTDNLIVGGNALTIPDNDYVLDANLSGTTVRFILALATVITGQQTLTGGEGLQKRPIGDLVDALRQLGAHIEYLGQEGYPPLRISSSQLTPGTVTLNGSTSSQFLSALLMIAPAIGEVKVEVTSELASKPYVDMTVEALWQFGIKVINQNYRYFTVASSQVYNTYEYTVEGDVSSAAYFFAIAALTRSTLTLTNMNPRSIQADMGFLKILEAMGNHVTYSDSAITIIGSGVRPVEVNMEDCPDQAQTLAVLATFASGVTTISGVQTLRIKETERIKALEQELIKMGIQTRSNQDTLVVHGGNPQPASIATYGDHRMAMAFAVAGTKLQGMEIEEPEVVSKTFPDFFEKLAAIGVGIERLEA